MAVQREDFSIFLSSRVDSNENNTSAQFETKLAAPIRLEGSEWEVGLVSLNYFHTWYSLPKTLEFGTIVVDDKREIVPSTVMDIRDENGVVREIPCRGATQEDYNRIVGRPRWASITHPNDKLTDSDFSRAVKTHRQSLLNNQLCLSVAHIPRGNHDDPTKLCELARLAISDTLPDVYTGKFDLRYDEVLRRAKLSVTAPITFVADWEFSWLQILGFTKWREEAPILEYNGGRSAPRNGVETFEVTEASTITAENEVRLRTYPGMYVNTDIIKHAIVNGKELQSLAYVPLDTKYGELGQFIQNPPLYQRVTRTELSSIQIHLRSYNADVVPMDGGETTLLLHFRRRYPL